MLPLLAVYYLCGLREAEAKGLLVTDVDLERMVIHVRPNKYRPLKSHWARRSVPIPPQLAAILRAYLEGPDAPKGELLFPRPSSPGEMLCDTRKTWESVARLAMRHTDDATLRAALAPKTVRTKVFRHTFCAMRLQTLDNGQPVSLYTVQREMGHGSDKLVKEVYGHLGQVRVRLAFVEYPTRLLSRGDGPEPPQVTHFPLLEAVEPVAPAREDATGGLRLVR